MRNYSDTKELLPGIKEYNKYTSGTACGVKNAIMDAVNRASPCAIDVKFKHKKSRRIGPGTIIITITEYNLKPWWKFW